MVSTSSGFLFMFMWPTIHNLLTNTNYIRVIFVVKKVEKFMKQIFIVKIVLHCQSIENYQYVISLKKKKFNYIYDSS